MHRRRSVALLVAALGLSCGARGGAPQAVEGDAAASDEQPSALSNEALDEVLHAVETVRRLPLEKPIPIDQLPEQEFRRRLRAHIVVAGDADKRLADVFDFSASPPRAGEKKSKQPLEDFVAAYYDIERERIIMPLSAPSKHDEVLAVYAHEVHHALQHQHFPIRSFSRGAPSSLRPPRENLNTDDAQIAYLALIEGDAHATMGAYLGYTHGVPVARALRRLTDLTAGVPLHHGRRLIVSGRSVEPTRSASPHLVTFPYEEGMRFVADLHRAGGFELVNRAYESPPTSTMHILHPQRYVDGEQPVELRPPTAGVGQELMRGSWGELRTIMSLATCLPLARARKLAGAWRGDAFVLGRRQDGRSASAWWSVWAADGDAAAFADALAGCNKPLVRVHRHADRVLVAAAVEDVAFGKLKHELASMRVEQPASRPLAEVTIPERTPIPERRKGRLEADRYQSIWLGLNGSVPPGGRAEIGDDELELTVSEPQSGASGFLALYDHVPRGRSLDRLFAELVDAARQASGIEPLDRGRARHRGPLGDVIVQRYALGALSLELHVVPVCAETGALVWFTAAANPVAADWLHRWRQGFAWIADRRIPACRWLDPK